MIAADSNNTIEWVCSWFYNLRLLVLLKKLCTFSLGEHVPLATGTNLDGFIGLTTVFLKPLSYSLCEFKYQYIICHATLILTFLYVFVLWGWTYIIRYINTKKLIGISWPFTTRQCSISNRNKLRWFHRLNNRIPQTTFGSVNWCFVYIFRASRHILSGWSWWQYVLRS
jgi:hypothetical protein